jgi:glycerophosphoryl diester phosphodiesterase
MRAWEGGNAPWTGGFDRVRHGGLLPAIRALGAAAWFPFYPDLTPQTVAEAHALGLVTGAWTVNEPREMQRLMALGVRALCTDRPDLATSL